MGDFLQLVIIVLGLLFWVFIEFLDWQGRLEIIQVRYPRLWGALNNRPARLMLLVVAVAFLVRDFKDVIVMAPPPIIKISPPPVPVVNTTRGSEPAKTITRTLPAPPEPKNCWSSEHFVIPNSNINGAKWSTEVVVYCNYRIESPLSLVMEFDGDIIEAHVSIAGGEMQLGGAGPPQGKIVQAVLSSPPMPAHRPMIVTVQSREQVHHLKYRIGTRE